MTVNITTALLLADEIEKSEGLICMVPGMGNVQLGIKKTAAVIAALRASLPNPTMTVTVNDDNTYTDEDVQALERLVKIAIGNTGQSRRVANFLLAWWNATDNGGFDLIELWSVDLEIAQDMLRVFALVANCRHYADHYGLDAEFRRMVTMWRRPKRKAARR